MADEATFTWYGHACVELRTPGGKVVLLDPWFGNPASPRAADDVTECDVMLLSHGHADHLGGAPDGSDDPESLAVARRTRPAWVAIHELSLWLEARLEGAGVEIVGMNKGGTVEARGLRISMVRADHSGGDWSAAADGPLYLGEPVGFVIELEDGRRVIYTGDTDVFGDMALIRERWAPTVAIMPIGGHYTMDPAGAARAAVLLGVRAVFPIHYGTYPILAGTPDALRAELSRAGAGDVVVVAPEHGVATPLP